MLCAGVDAITEVPENRWNAERFYHPTEIPQLSSSMLRSEDITGCILSALLSARRPGLAPTIGLIEPATARQHWDTLAELEFTAAALNYEGTYRDPQSVSAFRDNTGLVVPPV